MISQNQHIQCPVCQNPISFDPHLLVQGHQFSCGKCGAAIGLSANSKDQVKDTMKKFDELKALSLKK